MSQGKTICSHKKGEQKYLCLSEKCVKGEEAQLCCFKCLSTQTHRQHCECLQHIDDIFDDATKHQQSFIQLLRDELIEFCKKRTTSLENNKDQMKFQVTQWIDVIFKAFQEQVQNYERTLTSDLSVIESIQISKDQLKTLIEIRNLDIQSYQNKCSQIESKLCEIELSFQQHFNQYYERLSRYTLSQISDKQFPVISYQYLKNTSPQLVKCQECSGDNDKKAFCIHQDCIADQLTELQCSQCFANYHHKKNYQGHLDYIISADELFNLQKEKIKILTNSCQNKSKEVFATRTMLEEIINNYLKESENKMLEFRNKIIQEEQQLQNYLVWYSSKMESEDFTINLQLFKQCDYEYQQQVEQYENRLIVIRQQIEKLSHQFQQQGTVQLTTEIPKGSQVNQLIDDLEKKCREQEELVNRLDQEKTSLNQVNDSLQLEIQKLQEQMNKTNMQAINMEQLLNNLNVLKADQNGAFKEFKEQQTRLEGLIQNLQKSDSQKGEEQQKIFEEMNQIIEVVGKRIIKTSTEQLDQFQKVYQNSQEQLVTIIKNSVSGEFQARDQKPVPLQPFIGQSIRTSNQQQFNFKSS